MEIRWIEKLKKLKFRHSLVSEIHRKYLKLKIRRPLTRKQKKEIRAYFKPWVKGRIPLIWHKFMYSRTAQYHVNYIPLFVYRSEMIGRMNHFPFMDAYADKNFFPIIFPDINQPRIIIQNIRGYYYSDNQPITKEKAVELCSNLSNAIIKPAHTTRGIGVRKLITNQGVSNIDGKSVEEVLDSYGVNFLVQEFVDQHPDMSKLNPSSVNTIRLLTYRSGMEIILLYGVIRIGKKDAVIDNESAGGISAKINDDGTLAQYAYGVPGDDQVEVSDGGVTLKGYPIPSYNKVVETAKKMHFRLPYFDIVAWDFAVDRQGEPLCIEWNANPDLSQTAGGPAFGEYTERVFNETYKKVNSRKKYW